MVKMLRRAVATVVGLFACAHSASAQCVQVPLGVLLKEPAIALVFRGTVHMSLTQGGRLLAWNVTRLWKGDLRDLRYGLVLYQPYTTDSEDPTFREQGDYFVVARRQSPDERKKMGVPRAAPQRFAATCLSMEFESPATRQILGGAPGSPPR